MERAACAEQCFPVEGGQLVCRPAGGAAGSTAGSAIEVRLVIHPRVRGLYRGYLLGPSGRMELGTLLPEGECLALLRHLSVDRLRETGCWPPVGGEVVLSYAFAAGDANHPPKSNHPVSSGHPTSPWRRSQQLGRLFPHDPLLAREAEKLGAGFLCRCPGGAFCLAFPWRRDGAFPMTPVFCFCQVRTLFGQTHMIFHFEADGRPARPEAQAPCQTDKTAVE